MHRPAGSCTKRSDRCVNDQLKKGVVPDRPGPTLLGAESAAFEHHEAGALALGVGVVAHQTHVMVGVSAVASFELAHNHVQILLTEEGQFPIGPVGRHGTAGVHVLDERAPTLGNDVRDLVVDLVLGHRREEAEGLQGGDCLVVTHGALERHGVP